MIIALAGLPGTGKSTIARQLAQRLPAVVLDKDRIRAALFPPERIDYATLQDDFCMGVMMETAGYLWQQDATTSVIFDGRTFACRYQLDTVAQFAATQRQPLLILECICANVTAHRRLEDDIADATHLAGNRDYNLYLAIQQRFEPIDRPKLVVNTDDSLATCVDACLTYIQAYRNDNLS